MRYEIAVKEAGRPMRRLESAGRLLEELNRGRAAAALVCKRSESEALRPELPGLLDSIEADSFRILIRRKNPPELGWREDPPVESFAFGAGCAEVLLGALENADQLCSLWWCLSKLIRSRREVRITARQFPAAPAPAAAPPRAPLEADWVVPHRGPVDLLDQCLAFVTLANRGGRIWLGIDELPSEEIERVAAAHDRVAGFYAPRPQSGPYLLKNLLIALSGARYVCLQDSDDIPCHDRLAALEQGFDDPEVGMVGSHEIRLDDASRAVIPVRFPLDVRRALRRFPFHSFLHPTALMRRDRFWEAGGFSSFARSGLDTQFMLRADCYFKIRNVDAFAYLRRIRPESLTRHPETGLDSLSRIRNASRWRSDFIAVSGGKMSLERSSLPPIRGDEGSLRPLSAR